MLGHKDHGKSTLIGRMLISSGKITPERVKEAEKASSEVGTEFEPAFLLDTFSDERQLGMTFDNTRVQIPYKDTVFELIDVPGHEELMRSMMSGSSSADFAAVVISSKEDEGITDQTRRHIYVAKLFGIDRFVVAINKMDSNNFDEKVFDNFKWQITDFLRSIGVPESNFSFIPVSARNDINVWTIDKSIKWYRGRSLFDELHAASLIPEPANAGNLEPRVIVQSVLLKGGNTALLGKVISGKIHNSGGMTIVPGNKQIEVKDIFSGMQEKKSAGSGESVAVITSTVVEMGLRGSVLTTGKYTGFSSNHFKAHVFFLEQDLTNLSILLMDVPTKVTSFTTEEIIDPVEGVRKDGKIPVSLDSAIVSITTEREIAFDSFHRCREMGSVVIIGSGKLVASGTIISD